MKSLNSKYIRRAIIILPILLALICLADVIKNDTQAFTPVPKEYIFSGEYSYDGINWYPYSGGSEISAFEGDLIVKGHLDSDIEEGGMLNIYSNHIGVTVYVNGELLYIDEQTNSELMPSICGKRWTQILCPLITTEDEIAFRFVNPHNHGNKTAYKEALSSLCMTPPDNEILEVYLKAYIRPFQMLGYAMLIIAIMLLGASLSAVLLKSVMSNV